MYATESEHQVIHAGVSVPETPNPKFAILEFGTGSLMPVGPQQAVPVPHTLHKFSLNKKGLRELIDALTTVHESLADESDLITASDLSGVAKLADFNGQLRSS
jgi:hypothetical protein